MNEAFDKAVDIPEELLDEKTINEVKENVLMRFELPNNNFAFKLKEACDKLLLQLPPDRYSEVLGYPFPQQYYEQLAEYCRQKPYGFP